MLVVGAGLAGTYAVAGLRRRGFDGHLVMVGAEPHRPYDRPPLSKAVLTGGHTTRLEDDLGEDLDVLCDELLLDHRVTSLDVDASGVVVRGEGWDEPADAVLVATGARPVVPAGWDGVLVLRTLDDAARLRAALVPGARLVVAGAGWIGAEVASSAAAVGCQVTVVEALPTPLGREIGTVGDLTRPWYATAGVRLLTGRRVVSATGERVVLDDGEELVADAVVAAVGVLPDAGWLGSGAHGVEVGADLRAVGPLAPHVLAAGDCAVRWSPRYDRWVAGGHWEEAMLAGDAAAATLAGEDVVHDPVPYVFSTQFGREVALAGRPHAGARVLVRGEPAAGEGFAAAWVLADTAGQDRLVALLTVDRPRDVAQTRRALGGADGTGVPVDTAALGDPDVPVRAALRG